MITVTLPWPDKALSPNGKHGAWQVKWRAKKAARQDALILARQQRKELPPTGLLKITIVALPPDRRRRDRDNLLAMLKPSLDGIAQALDVDDSRFVPFPIEIREPEPGGQITITVEPLND